MHRRLLALVPGIALLVLLGLGVNRLVSAQTGPQSTPRQAAGPPSAPGNPDAGLTNAERNQKYDAVRRQFVSDRAAFRDAFNHSGYTADSLRAMRQAPIMASYVPPPLTLDEAVSQADEIVVGTAQAIRFDKTWFAYSTVAVESVLKGKQLSSIEIQQYGGPAPGSVGETALETSDAEALLFPGDRVILFLKYNDAWKAYYIEAFTGTYHVQSHQVVPMENNPFDPQLSGIIEGQAIATVNEAIQRTSPHGSPP